MWYVAVTSLSLKNTTGAFIWFLYFWDVNKKKKRQQSKQMYQCIYKVSKNWQHFFGKHSPTRRKSKERFIIVKKIPFLTESDATFCIRWMQNVFLLKENSSKYYLAATSILKVCDSASFKKQNHKLRIMCTETDHHCLRADMLNPPLKALKSSSVPVPVWAHLTARMASYDLPVRHTCTLRKPVLVSMRVYSDGGRSRPSACTSMLREKIWAMTGPRRFSNSMASTSRTPPPDGTTDKDTKSTEKVWKCSERSIWFVSSFCSVSLVDVLGRRLTCSLKLTWFAGVVDPPQQRQALLLRPVVNDSGQNVEIGRRDFTGEEISWTHDRNQVTASGNDSQDAATEQTVWWDCFASLSHKNNINSIL